MGSKIDVGGVISRTFNIYVDQASVLIPAAAVVFVITGIVSALLVAAAPALVIVGVLAAPITSLAYAVLYFDLGGRATGDVANGGVTAPVGI